MWKASVLDPTQKSLAFIMLEFLTSPVFKYALLPIGSAALGVAVKYTSRNDQYAKFRKEELAVGLNLALTGCLMFVVLTTDRAVQLLETNQQLAVMLNHPPIDPAAATKLQAQAQLLSGHVAGSGWLIAFMFLGLASMSTLVRKWGWQSETEMQPVLGIALPLAFGILTIIVVMARAM